jgi:hypothetical protein
VRLTGELVEVVEVETKFEVNDMKRNVADNLLGTEQRSKVERLKTRASPLVGEEVTNPIQQDTPWMF